MQVKEEPPPEPAGPTASPTAGSAPIVIQQAPAKPEALILDQPTPLEPHLPSSALSQSAPSSFWHIQADHAYQVGKSSVHRQQYLRKSCDNESQGGPLHTPCVVFGFWLKSKFSLVPNRKMEIAVLLITPYYYSVYCVLCCIERIRYDSGTAL